MRLRLLMTALSFFSCTTIRAPPAGAPPKTEAGAKARKLIEDGARLVDVRTRGEFEDGHIEGALNIPVDVVKDRAAELEPRDKPVVVYCRSGHRSAIAAKILREAGFSQVYDMGSIRNW
jgi:phage shock protein E